MPRSERSDAQRLRLFCDRVERLMSRRGLSSATVLSKIGIGPDDDLSSEVGDVDDLISVLTYFRFFTAQREDTEFVGICILLDRCLDDRALQQASRQNRAAWKVVERGDMLVTLPEKAYNGRDCYDLWINAEIFHADYGRERLYLAQPESVQGVIRAVAVSFVLTAIPVLHRQRLVAEAYLRS